jgi:hypothetical protein
MTANLTRCRSPDAAQETWPIYCGDVRVGVIAERVGNPTGSAHWHWSCGFYPGSHPRECTRGTAVSFADARMAFEAAWSVFLANRTEADFEAWRRHQAFDAWKRGMWDAGCKLPTQVADGCSTCFCGAAIGIGDVERHVLAVHMMSETL